MIRPLIRRLANAATARVVAPWFLSADVREQTGRQEFFANAFKALRFNGIDGDYAEFGSGRVTFPLAWRESRRYSHAGLLWSFDSFKGLPPPTHADVHPSWIEGKMDISLEEFRQLCEQWGIPADSYRVVPGYFEETLPNRSPADEPANIALAYVDCDFYSSTKTVLSFLEPRLKQGMIVAFDDYFCLSATAASGERKAMLEVAERAARWEWLPYQPFGWSGMSFMIEDRSLL